MDLDYSEKGVVKVLMIKYLKKVLRDFPEDISSEAEMSAAYHLFQVHDEEEAKFLPDNRQGCFIIK